MCLNSTDDLEDPNLTWNKAPRGGPGLASDFYGPIHLEFEGTMNWCNPDDCAPHALVSKTGPVVKP